jgi:hypothetical protein
VIFSFTTDVSSPALNFQFDGDVFCFFSLANTVVCPSGKELNCLLSTLRLKRPVLVLNSPLTELPAINLVKRWDSGENWIWIAPRGMSHIADLYPHNSLEFVPFKSFLMSSK